MFRVISEKTGVPEGYRNAPGKDGAYMGHREEGRKGEGSGGEGEVAGPLFPSPIWTKGEGAQQPFSSSH